MRGLRRDTRRALTDAVRGVKLVVEQGWSQVAVTDSLGVDEHGCAPLDEALSPRRMGAKTHGRKRAAGRWTAGLSDVLRDSPGTAGHIVGSEEELI